MFALNKWFGGIFTFTNLLSFYYIHELLLMLFSIIRRSIVVLLWISINCLGSEASIVHAILLFLLAF